MEISQQLKTLLGDNYFLTANDVDVICNLGSAVCQLQQAIEIVSAKFTIYEVNALIDFITKEFPTHCKVSVTQTDSSFGPEVTITLHKEASPTLPGAQIVIKRADVRTYSFVPHQAVTGGFGKLQRKL